MIWNVPVALPQEVARQLRPNDVLEEQFRAGYRMAVCKERGFRRPDDLHRNAPSIALLRAMVLRAFRPLKIHSPVNVHLILAPQFECDDDAWLFMVKPTLDAIAESQAWKDRRRFLDVGGSVARDLPGHPTLTVRCWEEE